MFISQKLRKESIAEYLLYMWQVEDIIRAHDCYMPAIRRNYLSRFELSEDELDELTDWYSNLLRMMNEEGCREEGHIQINRIVIQQLEELHSRLINSPKFPFYSAEYYKVLPFIVELRTRGNKDVSELETCFNALYGVMMLRLQQKELKPETEMAIKEITTFIGMLSDYYKEDKENGIDFDD